MNVHDPESPTPDEAPAPEASPGEVPSSETPSSEEPQLESAPSTTAPPVTTPVQAALDQMESVVLGQERMLRQMLIVLLAEGHGLLEGVPGTGKTLSVRTLARTLDLDFGRVQFTPDLMPTDLVGVNVLDELNRTFVYHQGPVFTDILLADEINRAPAKTQAALLEAMEERQVTVDGETRRLPDAFTVFATQNPIEYEGTYPLPEARLDRFLLKIQVEYPPEEAERGVLDRYAEGFRSDRIATFGIGPVVKAEDLSVVRDTVRQVHVEPKIRDYITDIVRATRREPSFSMGASPRAGVALFLASRAEALLSGRDFVTPDDVKALAFPVLRHRVLLTPEAEVEGDSADDRLRALLATLEAPR